MRKIGVHPLEMLRVFGRNTEINMEDGDPNLVTSNLSGTITRDGITVELCIYRLEENTEWILEVVNSEGASIVWDEPFRTDSEAKNEFERVATEDGMRPFLDNATVIQFPSDR